MRLLKPTRGVRSVRVVFLHVRHQADIDAAVLRTAGGAGVRSSLFVLTKTYDVHLVRRDAMFRGKVLSDRGGTTQTKNKKKQQNTNKNKNSQT